MYLDPQNKHPVLPMKQLKLKVRFYGCSMEFKNEEAKKIVENAKIQYVSNRCIKQEYQRLFLKSNPVFPVLKN